MDKAITPLKRGFMRPAHAVVLACIVLVVLGWAVTLQRIDFERGQEIANAQRHTANLVLAFEEHMRSTLKSADQLLRTLVHEYREHGRSLEMDRLEAEQLLEPGRFTFVGIADQDGTLLDSQGAAMGVNVADRDYFRNARASKGGFYVGVPITGRVTRRAEIPFARRITLADGGFVGAAIAGMDPSSISHFYSQIELGRSPLILLVGFDGVVRARWDSRGHSWGQSLRDSTLLKAAAASNDGTFVSRGVLDGIERRMSFRVLREYGLVVAVGTSVRDTLEAFEVRRRNYLALWSAATVLLLGLGAALAMAVARQERAMHVARASERRYRATFDQTAVGVAHASPDGRFLRANRKFGEMLGYGIGELERLTWAEITHPDDVASGEELRRKLLADPGAALPPVEKRYRRKDGGLVWASVAVGVVRHGNGVPDYLVAMIQDVGERKAAEAGLHAQLDELRRFQQVTVDRELRMIELKDQLAALTREVA